MKRKRNKEKGKEEEKKKRGIEGEVKGGKERRIDGRK